MGHTCIPLPLSLSFHPTLLGKCVSNIVKWILCFHTTSTTGNSALANNKKKDLVISLGREFRTSAVHSGADPVSQGHGSWAAMASSKGFGCVENTLQEVTGKATAGYETARMSAWACLRCSAHLLHWHSVVDASWMNGGAREMLLKATEMLSSPAKIINFVPR